MNRRTVIGLLIVGAAGVGIALGLLAWPVLRDASGRASQIGHVSALGASLGQYLDRYGSAAERRAVVESIEASRDASWAVNRDPPGGRSTGPLQDHWDRPIRFRFDASAATAVDAIEIRSAGPDGVFDTGDDVSSQ